MLIDPYPVLVKKVAENELSMTGRTSNQGINFQTNIRVIISGGKQYASDSVLYVDHADEAIIIQSALTDYYKYPDLGKRINEIISNAVIKGYDRLRTEHISDYQNLYNKYDLELEKTACSELPTDMRVNRLKKGVIDPRTKYYGDYDPELSALFMQYNRYLLISSAREGTLPPSIQFWNNSLVADWYGRFTTNVNLQENFWGVESANLSKLHTSLLDMAFNYLPAGIEVAQKSYKCRGAVFPGRGISIYGPEYIYDSWSDGGAWIGQHFWEHFLFTQDMEFLKRRAYPYMKEMALFYLDYLFKDKEGYLITGPSHSPENAYLHKGRVSSIDNGITMSRAITYEIFNNTIKASEILNVDESFRNELKSKIGQLRPYMIGRYGIQEWRKDYDEINPGHRHISQLYGLYPGCEITKELTTELFKAAYSSFMRRLESGGFWTGWSCSWGIGLAARLREGDKAYGLINRLMKDMMFDNLFTQHNRGNGTFDVFSMDGNLGSIGGMNELFLQSHNGYIELLPALPSFWKRGKIRGICARGGYEVDMNWENGELSYASIYSKHGGVCKIMYKGKLHEIKTNTNTKSIIEIKNLKKT